MSLIPRVVWSEGTLITPQHFQQSEQYYDNLIQKHHNALTNYSWGFQQLKLNTSSFKMGLFVVDSLSGFFADGTYFETQTNTTSSLKLQLPSHLENVYVYLAWSSLSNHQENYIVTQDNMVNARYISQEAEHLDYSQLQLPKRSIMVAVPHLRLVLESSLNKNDNYLPVAMISTNHTGEIIMNYNYIPPFLNMKAYPVLNDYMSELVGSLKQRVLYLSGIVTNSTLTGTGDVRHFMMLQTVNRYYAYIQHLHQLPNVHPCQVFGEWLKLYSDLTCFTLDKYNFDVPNYQHDNLELCFYKLMQLIRDVLSIVVEQRAVMLALETRDDATRTAIIPQANLIRSGRFVLALNASIPTEQLLQNVPTTIKISAIDKLNDLIMYHLPGIKVKALSTVPRELPYHTGFSYFELDADSDLWEGIEISTSIAIHLAGNFPELQMECWIIKPL